MFENALTAVRGFASTLYGGFVWPGEAALSQLAAVAPNFVDVLTLDHGAIIVPFVLALVIWTLVIVLCTYIARFCRGLFRVFDSTTRTIFFRLRHALGSFKTALVCRFRSRIPWRKTDLGHGEVMIEFDDLDLSVLHSASARGPGFTISAPELAEELTLRPAQIQRSLDRLMRNRLLGTVIGSTDGFDNYRLTDAGIAFLTMTQRQAARA